MKSLLLPSLVVLFAIAGCAPSSDTGSKTDAGTCTPGDVTLEVTTPSSYACHDRYQAKFVITNGLCSTLTVTDIKLTASADTGSACVAAAPSTLTPTLASVGAGKTVTVLDYQADPYCCTSPGCPAAYPCNESYTFTVDTSNGPLTQTTDVAVDIASCDQICS